jgi:hypothetical protein
VPTAKMSVGYASGIQTRHGQQILNLNMTPVAFANVVLAVLVERATFR